MIPRPRPVEALTTSTSSSAADRPSSCERASTSASLPTNSGARVRPSRYGASSTPSQPDMTGEPMLTPRSGSRVPARLSPTPHTGAVTPSRRVARRSAISVISSSGPTPTSWSRESEAISWPSRSATASWLRERPIATASTTPACWLNTSAPGGRPPVEASSSPRSSRPAEVSELTRVVIAVRDRPVRARSWDRVLARPLRTRSSSSPAVAGAALSRPSGRAGAAAPFRRDVWVTGESINLGHFELQKSLVVLAKGRKALYRDGHGRNPCRARASGVVRLHRLRGDRRPRPAQAAARALPPRPRGPAARRLPDPRRLPLRLRRRRVAQRGPGRAPGARRPGRPLRRRRRPLPGPALPPDARRRGPGGLGPVPLPAQGPTAPRGGRPRLLPRGRAQALRLDLPAPRRDRGRRRAGPGGPREADRPRPGLRA